jgi:hypothetical protein
VQKTREYMELPNKVKNYHRREDNERKQLKKERKLGCIPSYTIITSCIFVSMFVYTCLLILQFCLMQESLVKLSGPLL